MMMAITMMKCALLWVWVSMKCMHRNASFILWNSAAHSRARSRANAIVKPTRYLDRSLFDWNQNRTHCCCCCRCFFFILFLFLLHSPTTRAPTANAIELSKHIPSHVHSILYSRKRQCFLAVFFSLSLVFFSSISIGRVWTLGSMPFGGFARNSQLHAFLICFFLQTCVTNGIRCLTVACSSQAMACQSMHTLFSSLVCSFPCIKIHLFDFLAFHLFHRMQRNRIREKRDRDSETNSCERKNEDREKCGLKTTFVWFHWFADLICINGVELSVQSESTFP